jgi:hypothetical protein
MNAISGQGSFSSSLPKPMLLLSPVIIKESFANSEIENINTTVEKVHGVRDR